MSRLCQKRISASTLSRHTHFQNGCAIGAVSYTHLDLPDDGRRYIDEDTDWNYAPLDGEDTDVYKRQIERQAKQLAFIIADQCDR